MRTFIQIETDPEDPARQYVHWKFQAETNPYPPIVDIRDVTDVNPTPQEGWTAHSDGTYSAPIPPQPTLAPVPQPNTPNNPYFGKQRLSGAQFVGLCIGALGVTAANRVSADPAFASIRLWVSTADVVIDPDDKAGQFLQLAGLPGADGYLTVALASDGQPLMTRAQRDAIMTAWKKA